jgi:hypothetical protein
MYFILFSYFTLLGQGFLFMYFILFSYFTLLGGAVLGLELRALHLVGRAGAMSPTLHWTRSIKMLWKAIANMLETMKKQKISAERSCGATQSSGSSQSSFAALLGTPVRDRAACASLTSTCSSVCVWLLLWPLQPAHKPQAGRATIFPFVSYQCFCFS